MSPRAGRLLRDGAAPGPWNMGVDEALLASTAAGAAPALRLYRWSGSWLSLGYAQRAEAALLQRCAAAGVGVLRRATGGGAVLHGRDLGYCIVLPEALLPTGLAASHALLSGALREALHAVGVAAERLEPAAPRGAPAFDCFAAPAQDAIGAGGRKLVGSAQRRRGGAVLQHGSLRLSPDPAAAAEAAGLRPDAAISLAELGLDAGRLGELEGALVEAFAGALGLAFEASELSAAERAAAGRRAQAHATAPLSGPRTPRPSSSREPRKGR